LYEKAFLTLGKSLRNIGRQNIHKRVFGTIKNADVIAMLKLEKRRLNHGRKIPR
jgi:hypothetical protein